LTAKGEAKENTMKSLRFALAPLALAFAIPGAAMAQTANPIAAIAPSSTLLSINAEARSSRKPYSPPG
jgi:hypothetical protein